jgi:hypothetical protein
MAIAYALRMRDRVSTGAANVTLIILNSEYCICRSARHCADFLSASTAVLDNDCVAPTDRDINALYQLPLSEFTAARNALAKRASGDTKTRISRLKKPAVIPWAVDQVFWNAKPVYDRLRQRGQALRTAQIAALKGKASDVRAASTAHRAAVTDAVKRAAAIAGAAGLKPNSEHLARMFEAISLSPSEPADAGRWTNVIEPSGFEALAGVTPAGRSVSRAHTSAHTESAPAKKPGTDRAAERRRADEAEVEVRRRARETELEVARATRALVSARARADRLREQSNRADAELRAAERALVEAQRQK